MLGIFFLSIGLAALATRPKSASRSARSSVELYNRLVATRSEFGTERLALLRDLVECRCLIGEAAQNRPVLRVVAHELESQAANPLPIALGPHHHAEPVAMTVPPMSGMEREAAQPIKDRLPAVEFDRQREMRAVADHDLGAGVDRRVANFAHVIQHVAADTPMA